MAALSNDQCYHIRDLSLPEEPLIPHHYSRTMPARYRNSNNNVLESSFSTTRQTGSHKRPSLKEPGRFHIYGRGFPTITSPSDLYFPRIERISNRFAIDSYARPSISSAPAEMLDVCTTWKGLTSTAAFELCAWRQLYLSALESKLSPELDYLQRSLSTKCTQQSEKTFRFQIDLVSLVRDVVNRFKKEYPHMDWLSSSGKVYELVENLVRTHDCFSQDISLGDPVLFLTIPFPQSPEEPAWTETPIEIWWQPPFLSFENLTVNHSPGDFVTFSPRIDFATNDARDRNYQLRCFSSLDWLHYDASCNTFCGIIPVKSINQAISTIITAIITQDFGRGVQFERSIRAKVTFFVYGEAPDFRMFKDLTLLGESSFAPQIPSAAIHPQCETPIKNRSALCKSETRSITSEPHHTNNNILAEEELRHAFSDSKANHLSSVSDGFHGWTKFPRCSTDLSCPDSSDKQTIRTQQDSKKEHHRPSTSSSGDSKLWLLEEGGLRGYLNGSSKCSKPSSLSPASTIRISIATEPPLSPTPADSSSTKTNNGQSDSNGAPKFHLKSNLKRGDNRNGRCVRISSVNSEHSHADSALSRDDEITKDRFASKQRDSQQETDGHLEGRSLSTLDNDRKDQADEDGIFAKSQSERVSNLNGALKELRKKFASTSEKNVKATRTAICDSCKSTVTIHHFEGSDSQCDGTVHAFGDVLDCTDDKKPSDDELTSTVVDEKTAMTSQLWPLNDGLPTVPHSRPEGQSPSLAPMRENDKEKSETSDVIDFARRNFQTEGMRRGEQIALSRFATENSSLVRARNAARLPWSATLPLRNSKGLSKVAVSKTSLYGKEIDAAKIQPDGTQITFPTPRDDQSKKNLNSKEGAEYKAKGFVKSNGSKSRHTASREYQAGLLCYDDFTKRLDRDINSITATGSGYDKNKFGPSRIQKDVRAFSDDWSIENHFCCSDEDEIRENPVGKDRSLPCAGFGLADHTEMLSASRSTENNLCYDNHDESRKHSTGKKNLYIGSGFGIANLEQSILRARNDNKLDGASPPHSPTEQSKFSPAFLPTKFCWLDVPAQRSSIEANSSESKHKPSEEPEHSNEGDAALDLLFEVSHLLNQARVENAIGDEMQLPSPPLSSISAMVPVALQSTEHERSLDSLSSSHHRRGAMDLGVDPDGDNASVPNGNPEDVLAFKEASEMFKGLKGAMDARDLREASKGYLWRKLTEGDEERKKKARDGLWGNSFELNGEAWSGSERESEGAGMEEENEGAGMEEETREGSEDSGEYEW
ncbi:MAG: hypothetical protein Q9227_004747 [Pyrenula ochraceoflavens]